MNKYLKKKKLKTLGLERHELKISIVSQIKSLVGSVFKKLPMQ